MATTKPSTAEIEDAARAAVAALRRRCPTLSEADREDIAQRAQLEALDRYDPERGTFGALVNVTAHHRAIDLLRQRQRQAAPAKSKRAPRPATREALIEATRALARQRLEEAGMGDWVDASDKRGASWPEAKAWQRQARAAAKRAIEGLDELLELYPQIGMALDYADPERAFELRDKLIAEIRFWAELPITRSGVGEHDLEAEMSIAAGELPDVARHDAEDGEALTPAAVIKQERRIIRKARGSRKKKK